MCWQLYAYTSGKWLDKLYHLPLVHRKNFKFIHIENDCGSTAYIFNRIGQISTNPFLYVGIKYIFSKKLYVALVFIQRNSQETIGFPASYIIAHYQAAIQSVNVFEYLH